MSAPRARPSGDVLPVVALAVAVWAALPPYVGPSMPLDPVVEIVDHVVPAAVVGVAALVALVRRAPREATGMFVAGLLVALAGVWMVSTHVPLVAMAARGGATALVAAWHTVPGLAVLALGALWAARSGQDASVKDSQADGPTTPPPGRSAA